ncbi:MAG: hypothetical protein PHQ34_01670 [Methanothrix sp.]|nr:hypothetical protein [Methanothrix sp.]
MKVIFFSSYDPGPTNDPEGTAALELLMNKIRISANDAIKWAFSWRFLLRNADSLSIIPLSILHHLNILTIKAGAHDEINRLPL